MISSRNHRIIEQPDKAGHQQHLSLSRAPVKHYQRQPYLSACRKKKMCASRSPTAGSSPRTSESEPSPKAVYREIGGMVAASGGAVAGAGASADLLVAHAEALMSQSSADWKEALDLVASVVASGGGGGGDVLKRPQLRKLVTALSHPWARTGGVTTFSDRLKSDWKSCSKCAGVLHQVVSLGCGHSYCRKCVETSGVQQHCTKCGWRQLGSSSSSSSSSASSGFKTNVTISNLVEKWWAGELKAVDLRSQGNQSFGNNRFDEALDKYNQAAQSAPNDFTLFSNRSNVFNKIGKYEEALKDADQAIRLRPDWPKGYYRRAAALKNLGRHDESLIALLHCTALEKSLQSDICDDIAKIFVSIISTVVKQSCSHATGRNGGPGSGSDDSNSSSEDLESPMNAGVHNQEQIPIHSYPKLHKLVDRIFTELERLKKTEINPVLRTVDATLVDSADFECTLCCRLLWQPVTTPCGHTFCRTCLDRCMDHTPACPLCKTSLEEYLAERRQNLTEFLDSAMSTYLPEEYAERSRLHEEEMKELSSLNKVPIFICTMAFPTMRCPLHVFEPRYRLMIRRCMESGSRQFGMCAYLENQPHGFAQYGTMLEVRDVEFFADGRSVVDTVGGRRFKVLHQSLLDGYYTANVEFLADQPPVEAIHTAAVVALHQRVREAAESWINSAPASLRQRILQHFGTIPPVEADWITLPNGPAWLWWLMAILPLDSKAQLAILSMTRVEKRLEAIHRVVAHVRSRQSL